ncbi:MAG: ABC transporter permease subunit [Actinomycetota bacterium]
MIRLVRVEVAKVRTTRMWIGLLLGAAALVTLGAVATLAIEGSDEATQAGLRPIETVEDVRDFVYTGSIAGVLALVLGATTMTNEHRHRTLAGTFLATPTRWPVIGAKVIGSGVVGFVFGVIGGLIPLVAVAVRFAVRGEAVPLGISVALAVGGVGVSCAFSGAMGAAVGAALRSQLIAIIGVLGWALVVEPLIGGLVPDALRWLPFSGVGSSLGQQSPDLFSPAVGAALMAAYVGAATATGVVLTLRRDVD